VPLTLRKEKAQDRTRDALLEPAKDEKDELEAPKGMAGSLATGSAGLTYVPAKGLPRLVRAQVNLSEHERQKDGSPQLFSVEAVGPCTWSGLLRIPAVCRSMIETVLKDGVAIGRKRSHFGAGTWEIIPSKPDLVPRHPERVVLVLQSPVRVPDTWNPKGSPDADLKGIPIPSEAAQKVLDDSTWKGAKVVRLRDRAQCHASLSVRFGWNRHGRRRGLQRPCLVLTPGSVIEVTWPAGAPDQQALRKLVEGGLGAGREDGFGAIRLHPRTLAAGDLIQVWKPDEAKPTTTETTDALITWALGWATRAKDLPAPSQLAQIITLVAIGDEQALNAHLDKQATRPRFSHSYKAMTDKLKKQCGDDFAKLKDERFRSRLIDALRLIQDIAITTQEDRS